MRVRFIALSTLLLSHSLHAASTTQPIAPSFSDSLDSIHVPFARKVDFDHLTALHIRISINGGPPTVFQVDTGSVGVIVGADEVPNIDASAPAGSITYSSSGIELDGVWTSATLTFPDSKEETRCTLPILAASERKLHDGAVNAGRAKPSTRPSVHMLGIGFGRGKEPHPERNPFLNLDAMNADTMRRGYEITRDGFVLGLSKQSVGDGFVFQKLSERGVAKEILAIHPGLKDWNSARGNIIVDGKPQPDAAILIDTGLTNMMIGNPQITDRADIANGTPITVNLLGGTAKYDFKVGDESNASAPRKVTWTKPSTGQPNLNTGLRALAHFDYLFDADEGFLGLRPIRTR